MEKSGGDISSTRALFAASGLVEVQAQSPDSSSATGAGGASPPPSGAGASACHWWTPSLKWTR